MAPLARAIWMLVRDSVVEWRRDDASRKGAALAYYTIFSLAPILIISIAIAGLFLGEQAVRGEIVGQIGGLIGENGSRAVQAMIENAARPGAGLAAVVGVVTLLAGATSALAELKSDLDEIWGAPRAQMSGFWYLVRTRLLSIGLILALGFLMLVSLALSAMINALAKLWSTHGGLSFQPSLIELSNFLFSFAVVTTLFAMIYKILPAVRIAWRDVIIGAAVTALLFDVGKYLIGVYIGNTAIVSTYGAAGSVILILVWVYYSTQIFLLGAEFTKVYAYRYGSRRREKGGARTA